jgi:nucleotide-binding universal stress UspA family protein
MMSKENSNFTSKILVPTDGSSNAGRALDVAINIAKAYSAKLVVLNVIPPLGYYPSDTRSAYEHQQKAGANRFVEEAIAAAKARGLSEVSSQSARTDNSVVEEIINVAANDNIDLIVIGTRGIGGFKKLLQGSVSSGVVAHAHCNVLVVR